MTEFDAIFRALADANARFVVVGGLATVLHGYVRVTADVDLVVDLSPGEAIKPVAALSRIGMVPRAPVEARDFADAAKRRMWIEEKGMRVFSMWNPRSPLIEVDLLVDPPLSYEELRSRAVPATLSGLSIYIAAINDMVAMKRLAGRAKDADDVDALLAIQKRRGG